MLVLPGIVICVVGGIVAWRLISDAERDEVAIGGEAGPQETAPLCPWREPDADLKAIFPSANRTEKQIRILSGLRPELTKQLGRAPTAEENTLDVYRIYDQETPLGSVLVRRVKGQNGAIELVIGISTNGTVSGLRVQRSREPENIAVAVESPAWLGAFAGKTAESKCRLGEDLPDVVAEARGSAEAIGDGVRDSLILLSVSQELKGVPIAKHH